MIVSVRRFYLNLGLMTRQLEQTEIKSTKKTWPSTTGPKRYFLRNARGSAKFMSSPIPMVSSNFSFLSLLLSSELTDGSLKIPVLRSRTLWKVLKVDLLTRF